MQDTPNPTGSGGAPTTNDDTAGPFRIGDRVRVECGSIGEIDGERREDGVWIYDVKTDHGRYLNVSETDLTLVAPDLTTLTDEQLQNRYGRAVAEGDTDTITAARGERARRDRATEVAGLRQLCDFLEAHPEVPCRYPSGSVCVGPMHLSPGQITAEQFMAAVEAMDATVVVQDGYVRASKEFGPVKHTIGVPIELVATEERQVQATEYVMPDAIARRERSADTTSLRTAA